ncbi:Hypothetical predicted protein [Podarcis lilfordi]|uniref:Uncharacterized protein n=1 Tax=Podarcis lilfordi TaxID=74358 RepID=A0AA35P2C8_9SAUR|nr:Hypothetical predicted protein [Podarcis lilfordi]
MAAASPPTLGRGPLSAETTGPEEALKPRAPAFHRRPFGSVDGERLPEPPSPLLAGTTSQGGRFGRVRAAPPSPGSDRLLAVDRSPLRPDPPRPSPSRRSSPPVDGAGPRPALHGVVMVTAAPPGGPSCRRDFPSPRHSPKRRTTAAAKVHTRPLTRRPPRSPSP